MSTKKIVVIRGASKNPDPITGSEVIRFEELRRQILLGGIFKFLLRYKEAVLWTYWTRVMNKPFKCALLLRMLSHGKCLFKDEKGNIESIGIRELMTFLGKMLDNFVRKKGLLTRVQHEVQELSGAQEILKHQRQALDLSSCPVYLRTDLIFGLSSGGSVGHIAGVLNHLEFFTGKPIFMTTDIIPTVRKDIETKIVVPVEKFWDFNEIPGIYFNEVVSSEAKEYIGDRRISFVYQRYSLNNYSGVNLAQRLKVPFILEYNGSEIWMSRHWGKPLKYETLTEGIELLNLRAADLVVVVSQPMWEELVTRGIDGDKILMNPNGVDPDRYSPNVDGSRIRAQYHLDGRTVLGFIGTFGKWHGAEVLAEAFGRLLQEFPSYRERVRLLMIGDGIMMPQVKERLERSGALEAATLTGLVPQDQGPAYLAASDILVASHVPNPDGTPFFGSPTKLFEYMAMGKGIVASDLDQIGEVLKHDQTAWMVKPGDTQSLMFGLKALIDDQPMRDRLGRAARQEVVSRYTWKEHARKIIEKLKEHCR
jgi:glycosyltransferase involved in cell wall biosynthesis